jgi:hypothetical protein
MMIWPLGFTHCVFDDRASPEVHKYTVNISFAASTLSEKPASLDESPASLSHGRFNDQAWWEVVAAGGTRQ